VVGNAKRIYWDSSCFLCFLNSAETDRRDICEDILHHAQAREIHLYTSTYTIAEVIRPKGRSISNAHRLTPEEIAKIDGMFRWPWLKKIDVDQRVAFKAVELARDYGLLPADAVHGASAIIHNLDELQRWDRDFSKIASLIQVSDPARITPQGDLINSWRKPIGPRP
jgi:predicted nucleic acid-binding protein